MALTKSSKKRRWRGRDGVWRDRDFGTHAKLQRIYQEMPDFDINAALNAYAKQQLLDMAIGKFGQLGNEAVKRNPYYVGAQGLQSGGAVRQRVSDEAYAQIRAGQIPDDQKKTYVPWWR